MAKLMAMLKKILTAPFVWFFGFFLLLEDWLWNPLKNLLKRLTRWRWFRWLEQKVGQLPPYAALALFAVPVIVLFPLKFLGLYLIGQGKRLTGLGIFVIAKIVGTGLAAWVYSLTEPALSQLAWFVSLRSWFINIKHGIYERLRSSVAFRFARRRIRDVRGFFKRT
jgi:hypothetical protein